MNPHLSIGGLELNSPVLLAPMAGVTNMPFRVLCREIEQELTGTTSGLYVCEMITARAMVERNEKTLKMIRFADVEQPRSMQLYTVDPAYTYEAVRMIVEENIADHVDMNFGCPVPKVTRRGGGSAIPYKRRLYGNIVAAAVRAAEGSGVPITVKFRIGIDDDHHTHMDAGRIAAEEGAAAVALHARTAAERYSGAAHWDEIARLVEHMRGTGLPVIGNGDIFAAKDATDMMEQTGCHGVEVGRGCLGRPWLFAQIGAQLRGEPIPPEPTLGRVSGIIARHAELLAEHVGEQQACRDIRKHTGWYLRGFPVGGEFRKDLARVETLDELGALLATIADSEELAEHADDARGRQGSSSKVALPEGWLDDPEDATVPEGAEIENNGG
ncbi:MULTISPECIES: tRNA dihydrouridine synthase DusB [Corynebacterium]|uniref:tRNA-dihydrouridine synthase n=1 Tax=Corynebacterium pseudogenitalium TaxID=38303 RepID=A0ABD4TV26_9CORY|nr:MULTISPECIES: tRNA dihydrouridine synthase DusB [Corynebacterium]MCQ4608725.1 tRNA dihydrouridine synthase DusB [Corynebacterium pseudogenitalium]MCQ4612312.1 tRNA dihydrouridine synthase DusB [Corynebacterium sp. CCUG 51687]MCQ4614606.1 tRNA dihydrouridine synthase DusB [Corynebacterium pseudogenitalium]MCQ4616584.1 tRNA dihydrouridine synthase DusB [Corynebacterium pseudogenitalium]MDK8364044.1 tRNA dihydrouridine synthase DusB [Corynebacterium sp. UMB10119B]